MLLTIGAALAVGFATTWVTLAMGWAPLRLRVRSRLDAEALRAGVERSRNVADILFRRTETHGDWTRRICEETGYCMDERRFPVAGGEGAWTRMGDRRRIDALPWWWEASVVEERNGGSTLTEAVGGRMGFAQAFLMLAFHRWSLGRIARGKPCLIDRLTPRPEPQNPARAAGPWTQARLRRTARPAPPHRADTGVDERTGQHIALSLLAVASFVWLFGWAWALVLTPVVLLHEYGHLLAYRMCGKEGGAIMLVPFMGGLATTDTPHRSEFERAFCALMGPAICAPVTLVLGAYLALSGPSEMNSWVCMVVVVSGFLNLVNLLPILPLDGGHVFQSIARAIAPEAADRAVVTLTLGAAAILFTTGWTFFAAIAGFGALNSAGCAEPPVRDLDRRSATNVLLLAGATIAMHAGGLYLAATQWTLPFVG